MRGEIRWGLYLLGFVVVTGLGVVFAGYSIKVPVPFPFGYAFMTILLCADMFIEVCRGRSPQIISNARDGHLSINRTKDVHIIPWYDEYVNEQESKNKSLGSLALIFPGGVDHWGISLKSSTEYPVYIFPSNYLEYEEENIHVHANLTGYELEELSPYIRYVLKHFGSRVRNSTPIFYGVTSHMDGTATPKNLRIELLERQDHKIYTALETKLDIMYKEHSRDEERKKKPWIVKEVSGKYGTEE